MKKLSGFYLLLTLLFSLLNAFSANSNVIYLTYNVSDNTSFYFVNSPINPVSTLKGEFIIHASPKNFSPSFKVQPVKKNKVRFRERHCTFQYLHCVIYSHVANENGYVAPHFPENFINNQYKSSSLLRGPPSIS